MQLLFDFRPYGLFLEAIIEHKGRFDFLPVSFG